MVSQIEVLFQTDNGTEFINRSKKHLSSFEKVIKEKYQAKHKLIHPVRPAYNSDVESSHKLIEDNSIKLKVFTQMKTC